MRLAAIALVVALLAVPGKASAARDGGFIHGRLLPADAHSPAFVVRNQGAFTFSAIIDANGTVALGRDSNFGCVHLWPGVPLTHRQLLRLLHFVEWHGFYDLPRTIPGKDDAGSTHPESVTVYTREGDRTVEEMPFATNAHFDAIHAAIMRAAGVSFDCS